MSSLQKRTIPGTSTLLISIIIPCYNVEEYIEECLDSVYCQTYPNIEVICIDNNSYDSTWCKLENLQKQYPSIIIDKEYKKGAPAARNKGLKLAKGEWIQFLDADDLLLPEKLSHQICLINDSVDLIVSASIKLKVNGDEYHTPIIHNSWLGLFTTSLGNTCANLWNKDLLDKVNGWDENLKSSQEYDLMFRFLQNDAKIGFDDYPLTIIRERESGQISQSDPGPKWIRYIELREQILNYLKVERPIIYTDNKDYFEQKIFTAIRTLSPHNTKKALYFYKKNFDKSFTPKVDSSNTKPYIIVYQLFGFKIAEKIKSLLKND